MGRRHHPTCGTGRRASWVAETAGATSASSTPGADSSWSCSEITLPAFLAPPAPHGTTATIPVAVPDETTGRAARSEPRVWRFSWPAFNGLLLIVGLIAVHVCPYMKHAIVRTKAEQLVSGDSPPLLALARPRSAVIPAAAPTADSHPRTHHHRSQAIAGQSFDLTSEPECQFTRTRLVHGQFRDKLIKQKIALPRGLKPGSAEARDWLHVACERAKQSLPPRR